MQRSEKPTSPDSSPAKGSNSQKPPHYSSVRGPSLVTPVASGRTWKVYYVGTEWMEDKKRYWDGKRRIKEVTYLAFQPARPLKVKGRISSLQLGYAQDSITGTYIVPFDVWIEEHDLPPGVISRRTQNTLTIHDIVFDPKPDPDDQGPYIICLTWRRLPTLPNNFGPNFGRITESILRIKSIGDCTHWGCVCYRLCAWPSVKADRKSTGARIREINTVFAQAMANGESIQSLDIDLLREKLGLSPTPGSVGLIEPS